MKENKNVNYKARLWIDENSELHGISFANQKIPLGLFDELNKAMHEVVNSFNGKKLLERELHQVHRQWQEI